MAGNRRRVAVVGTGHRGSQTWALDAMRHCDDTVELVGVSDANPLRLAASRALLSSSAPATTPMPTSS